jgi:hypothetical protein
MRREWQAGEEGSEPEQEAAGGPGLARAAGSEREPEEESPAVS